MNNHWTNNIGSLVEVQSKLQEDIHLTKQDMDYFNSIIQSITYQGNTIKFNGRVKTIKHDPFNTILNEWNPANPKRAKWEAFIRQSRLGTPERFNNWCENDRYTEIFSDSAKDQLSFRRDANFNLVFSYNHATHSMDVYIRDHIENKQVRLLCNLTDANASKIIFHYLKLHKRLNSLINICSEKKVYDAILRDIAMGYHSEEIDPICISNSSEIWCNAYIPLKEYNRKGTTPAWDSFMSQFQTEKMKIEFMKWIYGILVDSDCDRRVLWIEGDSETGKTTVLNVISDYLSQFGPFLVGAIAQGNYYNNFSIASLAKARLAIYSDIKEPDFFKRRDIMNLTGGDTILIEEKFKSPEAKRLFLKIAVSSNFAPVINVNNGFETSRLLHIKIDSALAKEKKRNRLIKAEDFNKTLFNEMLRFLSNARRLYEDNKV